METAVRTPLDLLRQAQRLIVPLYQRRYVWDAEEQWQPLWQDILRTAGLRAEGANATHFLGAAVLQGTVARPGDLTTWEVVDGQQRLTTLQVAFDAVAGVLEELAHDRLVRQLTKLTHNDPDEVSDPADDLKFRHRNADGEPFRAVMNAPAPVVHDDLPGAADRIVRAHAFFTTAAREHLSGADEDAATGLVDALRQGLQLVVISLGVDEDSQVIFETLNARGTPLTPADLIKNLIMHRVDAAGGDAERVWREQWSRFEDAFWTHQVSAGRMTLARSTLFLQQWLISRTGREVPLGRLFQEFKHYLEHESGQDIEELVLRIVQVAGIYRGLVQEAEGDSPDLTRAGLAFYRFGEVGTQVAIPVVLWLLDPRNGVDPGVAERAIVDLESWVMRRMMLRATTADLGRVAARLIDELETASGQTADEVVRGHLAGLTASSTYWPGDDEVRQELTELRAYRRFKRGRLRVLLEAMEDAERGFATGTGRSASRVMRRRMHIEHLLPQNWKPHWPVQALAQELARDEHVHRLGNLTLLTAKLNSSVSNRAWLGERGKWASLEEYDDNLMTRRVRREHAAGWDEASIDARTEHMLDQLLATWPVPEGHEPQVGGEVGREHNSASVRDLVAAGLLQPGTELTFRHRADLPAAVVTEEGKLRVNGQDHTAPSAAGRAALGRGCNGWWEWRLPDGRRLHEVRDQLA